MTMTTPANPTPPAVGVFKSASGRTELTVTSGGELDLRIRDGRDVLTAVDVAELRHGLRRAEELRAERIV